MHYNTSIFFMPKLIAIGIGLIILLSIGLSIHNESHTEVIPDVTIEKLQQQQLISKNSTKIRYLIITNKGTFICESSAVNDKWNNSDLFWHLKEGETYTFYVSGYGKSILFDYQNLLEAKHR